MPACGLRRGSSGGPAWPIFINTCSRPSRGAKPRGADDRELPQERPHQAASRGGGEINARVPREDPVTQAMTIKARRAPGRRRPAQSPCFPFGAKGQAQARVSSKHNYFGATRPRPAGRQNGGHRGAQASVIVRVFGRRGPTLVRISVLEVPLQNGQLLVPFPLNIWEEARGLRL